MAAGLRACSPLTLRVARLLPVLEGKRVFQGGILHVFVVGSCTGTFVLG